MIRFWAAIMCAVALKWRDFAARADLAPAPANEWLAARMPSFLMLVCCVVLIFEIGRDRPSSMGALVFSFCVMACSGRVFSGFFP